MELRLIVPNMAWQKKWFPKMDHSLFLTDLPSLCSLQPLSQSAQSNTKTLVLVISVVFPMEENKGKEQGVQVPHLVCIMVSDRPKFGFHE